MRSPRARLVMLMALLALWLPPAPSAALQGAPSVSAFDGSRAYEHVRRLVAIGPRPAGTPANDKTRAYIISTLAALGLKAVEQPFEAQTPVGRVRMANVIATIPGRGPGRLALASHFDTKPVSAFRFVGANDGGSSTGALLELARVLKARPAPALAVELIFFDGEEAFGEWRGTDHTYGSRHYVEAARKSGTLGSLRALVLLDMIGDLGLNLRRDTNSTPWLTDLIWAQARTLGYAQHFLDQPFPVEDDHLPFLQAGVPSVDLIDLDYADWHAAGDTLDKVGARSLQIVGDVVLAALPRIEARLIEK